MNRFLQRLGVIDHLVVHLACERNDFLEHMSATVEPGDTSEWFNFEAFSSDRREYKGRWDTYGFSIRRKAGFFDHRYLAIANGRFEDSGTQLTVVCEINGWKTSMYFYYGFLIVFYSLFMALFLFAANKSHDLPLPMTFIAFHALLMLGLPLLFARRAVKRLKHDIERELHFIAGMASRQRR